MLSLGQITNPNCSITGSYSEKNATAVGLPQGVKVAEIGKFNDVDTEKGTISGTKVRVFFTPGNDFIRGISFTDDKPAYITDINQLAPDLQDALTSMLDTREFSASKHQSIG